MNSQLVSNTKFEKYVQPKEVSYQQEETLAQLLVNLHTEQEG